MIGFFRHSQHKKKPLYVGVIILVALLVAGFSFFKITQKDDSTVVVVLSPHYDDAVLSLGGMIAKSNHPVVVATFFTAGPSRATSTSWDISSGFTDSLVAIPARTAENNEALKALDAEGKDYFYEDNQYRSQTLEEMEFEIAKDIQALLAAYSGKKIHVYGPAVFTKDITHPDHLLLHKAYVSVMENYPSPDVSFYFYEDYPYVERFNKEEVISLEKNLENATGRLYERTEIPLSVLQLRAKEKALKKYASQVKAFSSLSVDIIKDSSAYTRTRCGEACEVVYKLFIVTE